MNVEARQDGVSDDPQVTVSPDASVDGELPTSEPGVRVPALRPLWSEVPLFLIAVTVSGALSAALALRLPRRMSGSTDVVGYPVFAAYNADRLTDIYYIGILFFPVTALAVYLGLAWSLRRFRKGRAEARDASTRTPDRVDSTGSIVPTLGGVLAVGASLGLAAAIGVDAIGSLFWVTVVEFIAAYCVAVAAASLIVSRLTSPRTALLPTVSRVNVLASPLTLIGLGVASAASRVTVESDGSGHNYPWLPTWAAVLLIAAVFGWIALRSSRAKTESQLRALERQVLVFVVFPVTVFLLLSALPGAIAPMDMFHDGEGLAAARLTAAGYFPWRDLMSIHGVFQDSVTPLVGMTLFENSRWGAEAGRTVILDPLSYAFLVVFIAWLFKRSWILVLSFIALILGNKFLPIVGTRFMFLPLILVLLGVTLERRKPWLGVVLGCVLAVQAVFVPETAFAIVACGLIVILHDFYHRRRGAQLLKAFSLSAWCVAGGGAVFIAFALVLLSQHALNDFLFYFALVAPNRSVAGGIPLDIPQIDIRHLNRQTLELLSKDRTYIFYAFATPVALLLAFLYYAVSIIRKRPLDTADWVIGAATIFAFLYYPKFLERADLGHSQQVYAEAVPLVSFLVYRACRYVDGALSRLSWGSRSLHLFGWQPAGTAVLLIAVLAVPGSIAFRDRLAATPDQVRPVVSNVSQIPQMGYTLDGIDLTTYTDLKTILDTYLHQGDWVFDFSNEPGLYYYLLGQNPRTRYYHVSIALPETGQQDLVGQLERDQPKLVVFSNDQFGLPEWDGVPNPVRHYDVSQYILDNYRPLLSSHTQIFYVLASAQVSVPPSSLQLSEPPLTDHLAFSGYPCDWGYAPNFLSISSTGTGHASAPVTLTTEAGAVTEVNVKGWAVDLEAGLPDSRVVVAANGQVIGEGVPTIDRPDVAEFTGKPNAVRSGFTITAPIPTDVLSRSSGEPFIQVFGVTAHGEATEIGVGPVAINGTPPPQSAPMTMVRLADGTSAPVRAGPSLGNVDWIDAPRYRLQLSPPPGGAWSDYRWLEIQTVGGFRDDGWSLIDRAGAGPGHEITFRTLDRTQTTFRVHVGSCGQWHGYGPAPLLLSYNNLQDIAAVRLIP